MVSVSSTGWIRSALNIRGERLARLPEKHARYEREVQRLEGIAEYVEYLAAGREVFDGAPLPGFAPKAAREMGYLEGRWFAGLLDRLDPGWKARMEAGDFDYLENGLEASLPGGLEPRGFSAEEQRKFREEAASDIPKKEAERKSLLRDFQSKIGIYIFVNADAHPFRLEMFDPSTVEAVAERKMIHTKWLILRNEKGVAQVLNRPCLTEIDERSHVVRLIIPMRVRRIFPAQKNGFFALFLDGINLVFKGVRVSFRKFNIHIFLE